jgi:general secretion pathway protein K
LISITMVFIISFLAVEVSRETKIEYIVTSQEFQRIRAYYAAKSGVELSLLRIRVYQRVMDMLGDKADDMSAMLDKVWQFPFVWPPVYPDSLAQVDKNMIKDSVKDSLMGDASYRTEISAESSKIDLNDLASPSESLAEHTRQQLIKLIQNRFDSDDDFAQAYRGLEAEELVNNIADWVDKDGDGRNQGDETSPYSDLQIEGIPPNRPFRTLEELRMVDGIDDQLFDLLKNRVTVYGLKGVNVNFADKEILMSIDEIITEEVADDILTRRNDPEIGPFKSKEDFISYLKDEWNLDTENLEKEEAIPIYVEPEYNFRITSIGAFGKTMRKITAIVYDIDEAQDRLAAMITTTTTSSTTTTSQKPGQTQTTTTTSSTSSTTRKRDRTGRPNVIYWHED